jgi:F-type H+-transporting ATPase subunit c
MKLSLIVATFVAVVLAPAVAFAQSTPPSASNQFDTFGLLGLGAGFAIGVAALGGTLAQGRATAAAVEGIARQPSAAPRIQTPMILGLAFIESLVLFTWAMALLLQGNIKIG